MKTPRLSTLLASFALLALVPVAARAIDREHAPGASNTLTEVATATAGVDSIKYAVAITRNNLMGITISNYGFIGNNFNSSAPSWEYPLGTGHEHLVRGGLWIGAQAIDDQGSFIGVSTGALDGFAGSSAQSATEFTPASLDITRRSTQTNDDKYNPDAVSEDDWIGFYSDNPAKKFSSENHRPLNILVRQENYDWSFADYAHMNIFHFTITNLGLPLRNVYVGIYAEIASGSRSDYFSWPPSSVNSLVGSWYNKKWVAYDDSLRLFREHYCARLPVPNYCDLGHVPEWVGYKLLGVRPGSLADTSMHVTFAAWTFDPGNSLRDTDVKRYGIMSTGQVQDLSGSDFQPETGDPVELISVGPFAELDPGDSVSVDFAMVGGTDITDIQGRGVDVYRRRARLAQKAYDLDYLVPVPPPSPRLKMVAREQALDFYWEDSPERFVDPTFGDSASGAGRDFEGYRVYLGTDRLDLRRVAQFDLAAAPHDTTGFNTGLGAIRLAEPKVIDGVAYQYRYSVTGLRDGFKYYTAVTSYDLGNGEIEPLESGVTRNKTLAIPGPGAGEGVAGDKAVVFPNPYRVEARWDAGQKVRDHYLWFANLPTLCTLRIYTLSGDLVFETAFDGKTYAGEGARGVYYPSREVDVDPPTLAGTSYAWDMITRQGQAAATGLYLYSVEDKTGKRPRQIGKFLIVKSDREK
jgi:hypothetical protein